MRKKTIRPTTRLLVQSFFSRSFPQFLSGNSLIPRQTLEISAEPAKITKKIFWRSVRANTHLVSLEETCLMVSQYLLPTKRLRVQSHLFLYQIICTSITPYYGNPLQMPLRMQRYILYCMYLFVCSL